MSFKHFENLLISVLLLNIELSSGNFKTVFKDSIARNLTKHSSLGDMISNRSSMIRDKRASDGFVTCQPLKNGIIVNPPWFTCDDGSTCLSPREICDGEQQCHDSTDEKYCCTLPKFNCGNFHCIPNSFVCDGENDCLNSNDERNCVYSFSSSTTTAAPTIKCNHNQFECSSGECITLSDLCNHVPNCLDKSDEGGYCHANCGYSNGNCSHICHLTPRGTICSCPDDYELSDNLFNCTPKIKTGKFIPICHFNNENFANCQLVSINDVSNTLDTKCVCWIIAIIISTFIIVILIFREQSLRCFKTTTDIYRSYRHYAVTKLSLIKEGNKSDLKDTETGISFHTTLTDIIDSDNNEISSL